MLVIEVHVLYWAGSVPMKVLLFRVLQRFVKMVRTKNTCKVRRTIRLRICDWNLQGIHRSPCAKLWR